MMNNRYYAACAFGLEATVKRELTDLGALDISAQDARVYFSCDDRTLAHICMCIRCADRIYAVLGEFHAETFDELFCGVRAIDFGDLIPKDAKIPVSGDAVSSVLGSVSDVQAVSKKAIITSMQRHYGQVTFEETKKPFRIYVTILKNTVTVGLNMVGAGLSRRGYRTKNTVAPIKETLAASLIKIARWYAHPFYDPMCGSGTIAIEAARMAKNIMPGEKRHFDAVHFGGEFKSAFDRERQKARDGVINAPMPVFASDVSQEALDLARFHAEQAGVSDAITFERKPVKDFAFQTKDAVVITNPPYAIRLGEQKEVAALYAQMGRVLLQRPDSKIFVICADDHFESKFGARADKKRKLYNGSIRTTYYQYYKKR